MRFSRLLLVAAAALIATLAVVACGKSSKTAENTGSGQQTVTVVRTQTVATPGGTTSTQSGLTPTTATKTSTTSQALGNACTAADLTAEYLGSNGAAGTIELDFALKNTGSGSCHTYGWPGAQFLSSSGKTLSTNATRTSTDVAGQTPASVLRLGPGDEASFRLIAQGFASGGGNCPNATELQIIAPDDTTPMKVAITGGVPACGHATLSPMQPGTSAASDQESDQGAGGSSGGGTAGGGAAGIGSGQSTDDSGGSSLGS